LVSSNSEILISMRLRSSKVVCDQLGKADFAAIKAFSTSSFDELGICPYISPFAGQKLSIHSLEVGLWKLPFM
jgi:hypothetical protein